ncbi:MAG: regulatory protein RecX [Candidatus Manganitrophus sp.]|nr:MAG: regulatory protein RecX [Candidatus Manganitrophus sp.]
MAESYRSTASRPARRAEAPAAPSGEREAHQTAGASRPADRAKQSAYRLLSYRDRSVKEIETKLAEKGYSEEIIAEVIASLKEANYLDDDRFARQWVRFRTEHRHFGPIRLKESFWKRESPRKKPIAPSKAARRSGTSSSRRKRPSGGDSKTPLYSTI